MCETSEWGQTWSDILQHRFDTDGDLDGHAVGNLLLAATWQLLGDQVAGLDLIGRLLGVTGRVLPMATTPLEIEADVRLREAPDAPSMLIRGQSRVAVTAGIVERVRLMPADAEACPEAVAAIDAADWVILGPGSWFTSVMPHLLLPGSAAALHRTRARIALTLNLEAQPGETAGYSAADHLRSLHEYAPDLRVDVVIADPSAIDDLDDLLTSASRLGAVVLLRQVGVSDGSPRHDPLRLAAAYRDAFEGVLGRRGREHKVNGRMSLMSLTADVKDELARLRVDKVSARKAEVAATLRFAGGLHIISGRIVIEAELDTGIAARRLRQAIAEVYGHASDVIVVSGGALRRGNRYVVRVVKDGEALARQTGLLDARGRPVRGLPPQVVSASLNDAVAAWRGAFLAHGSLTEPGRSSALEVTCPGPEAALALVGAARRLGIAAKAREVRGVDRVVIRDGDAISAMLTRMGAHDAVLAWEERRMRREVRGTANRLANFDDANLRRSAQAAVAAGARVQRAFEILGDEVPDHLVQAGRLRLENKQASLEELGQLAEPPLTKDAVAGRIRRLLAMADKRAQDEGIPDTEASLTPEMLDTL